MKKLSHAYRITALQRLGRIESSLEHQTELICDLKRAITYNHYDLASFLTGELRRYLAIEKHITDDLASLEEGKDIEGKINEKWLQQ